ncbi:MAG: GDP-mannose 4,6-dehydratase [Planctomycetota bacterium]|nr:GDP-mannose 4,6-dehydratase [Planctomycetota bacterium]
MSKCLVTGGAGFIGSHLTEHLLSLGHEVCVLDNLSTGRPENLAHLTGHPRLTIRTGSITDPVLLADAVRDVHVIYHLAAAVGVKLVADDPVRTIETNIYPTETLLRLAVQAKCRFYLASTSEVYGKNPRERWTEDEDLVFGATSHPRWAYGCSKAIDEFLALAYHRKFGLEVVIGRFFNVVGPRQVGHYGMVVPRFVDQALAGEPLIVYDDGGQTRCFAHVREVVQTVVRLMDLPIAHGQVFNIGSDQPVTIRQLAEEVIRRTGAKSTIECVPYGAVYGADFEDVRRRVPDLSRLEQTLGTKPTLSLGTILDDVIAWKRDCLRGERRD